MSVMNENKNIFTALSYDSESESESQIESQPEHVPREDPVDQEINDLDRFQEQLKVDPPTTPRVEPQVQDKTLFQEEFPALGTEPLPETKKTKMPKTDKTVHKFIIASSHLDKKKVNLFTDKDKMTKILKATRPCHFVLPKTTEGELKYGTCYRETCTFAHSLSELSLPTCAFDGRCNRFHGARDRQTGKVDKSKRCQFYHPERESEEVFKKRTNYTTPLLPLTSEESRKPRTKKVKPFQPQTRSLKAKPAPKNVYADQPPKLVRHDTSYIDVVHQVKNPSATKYTGVGTTIIRVPKEMAETAVKVALDQGLTDFKIEIQ